MAAALGRRYAVERELGRGGMGTVYLAWDRKHARRVAIKILPPDLASALGPERFLREIAIAARLSHPHILPLHDSGQAGGVLYYVMPWVEGESLRQRLDRMPPLPVEEAIAIARQTAEALAHAHAHGVIHRDVKPENILLHQGHALLADFGVARAVADSALSDSGLPLGTAAYASPEQAGGRKADPRSDVYSLGCVLYEMLAEGARPRARDGRALLEGRFSAPLPGVGTIRDGVPAWMGPVLARAMAQRADERYSSAGELAAALATGGPARRELRRPRSRYLFAALGIVLALGLAAAWLARRPAVGDPKGIVVAGFENRTGDTALAPVGEIATDYIARGLASTGLIHDVYDSRTTAVEAGSHPQAGPGPARELARRVGVGLVLWGNYYLQDDSLHFEAQLVDAGTGRLVLALAPAVGALADRTRVVETLRQRVMAGFAVAVNPGFAPWQNRTAPPTYDAYLEVMAADEAGWSFEWSQALDHLRRAASLDSTYVGARTAQAEALALNGDCAAADSVIRGFESRRAALSPLERSQLDWAATCGRHDREGRYRASLAMLDAAPRSLGATVLASIAATEANRPREALEILLRYDPRALQITGRRLAVYRDWVAGAYHALSDHRRELATAREGLGEVPGYLHLEVNVALALAALGDAAAAESLAGAWLARDAESEDWQGQKAECVALELRAHGHALASRRLMEQVNAWYDRRGFDQGGGTGTIPCLWFHFSPAYYTERWETARRAYERRLVSDSGNFLAHAALGALAARRGDRAAAETMDRWLASRAEDGNAAYARARIALLVGVRAGAWQLLSKAHDLGFLAPDHLDPDLEPLRADSAYRALFRPRG